MEAPSILAFRSDWPFEQRLAVSPLTHHSYQTQVLDIWLFLDHCKLCGFPEPGQGTTPLVDNTTHKTHSNTNRTKPPRNHTQWTHPLLFYLWMLTLDIKWASLITLFYCWISDQHQQRYSCVFDHNIESWNKNLSIYPVVLKCEMEMDQYPALCATI